MVFRGKVNHGGSQFREQAHAAQARERARNATAHVFGCSAVCRAHERALESALHGASDNAHDYPYLAHCIAHGLFPSCANDTAHRIRTIVASR